LIVRPFDHSLSILHFQLFAKGEGLAKAFARIS